jgi:hypothetical protein
MSSGDTATEPRPIAGELPHLERRAHAEPSCERRDATRADVQGELGVDAVVGRSVALDTDVQPT